MDKKLDSIAGSEMKVIPNGFRNGSLALDAECGFHRNPSLHSSKSNTKAWPDDFPRVPVVRSLFHTTTPNPHRLAQPPDALRF